MSTNAIQSPKAVQDLAQTLLRTFDKNRDGQLGSDEFSAFLMQLLGGINATGRTSQSSPTLPSTPFLSSLSGGGDRSRMEGFDFRKMDDPSVTTVKYKFARAAEHYNVMSVTDMTSAEALLRTMVPDLEKNGVTVLEVTKDRLRVLDDFGKPGWVDVIRGAGGPDPAFQWLPVS